MKKWLFSFVMTGFFSTVYAACWYSATNEDSSTFQENMDDTYNDVIKPNNDEAKEKYESMKENQVQKILEGFKTKNRLLGNIQILSEEDLMLKLHELHEVIKKKELDGVLVDTWSTE
jgi:hypothetical protein